MSDSTVREESICPVCGKGYTELEWDDRHSDDDGNDVHELCCPICIEVWGDSWTDKEVPTRLWSWARDTEASDES